MIHFHRQPTTYSHINNHYTSTLFDGYYSYIKGVFIQTGLGKFEFCWNSPGVYLQPTYYAKATSTIGGRRVTRLSTR